jgi:hypothetical protein
MAVEVFADIDVALAIDRERVRHVECAAEDALLTNAIDDFERFAQEDPHMVVRAVDHVEEALVRGEDEPGGRSGEQRRRCDRDFAHELSVAGEDLDAVVGAICDIDEAVPRQCDVVRQAELLRRRRSGGSADTANLGGPANLTIDNANNELYIGDSYRNRRVIVIDTETLAFERIWGAYGNKPDARVPP